MVEADLVSFLVGFGALWAGIGLYVLHLARRTQEVADVVARLEVAVKQRK